MRALHDFLLASFAQNIPVVLVLDEAQNLAVEGFEQLRMIGNLEADDAKLLQVAIVGQPELQRMFLSPQLRQLRQRIFRSFHLPALTREATEGYVRHRLSVVTNAGDDIFNAKAIDTIYNVSRGLPRVINTVCDNALLSAYSAGRRELDGPFIESVVAQMMTVGGPRRCGEAGTKASATPHPSSLLGLAGTGAGQSWDMRTVPALSADALEHEPGPHRDSGHVPGLIDTLAQRVSALETRFSEVAVAGPIVQTDGRPQPHARRGEITPVVSGELATLKGDVRSNAEGLARRLTALEDRSTHGGQRHDELAEARAAHARLEPLVRQALALVARAETASKELERHNGQLGELAGTVKNVVRDLHHLLDRARETAAKSDRAERDSRAIHDRLVAQSQRSRRLADELAQVVNPAASRALAYQHRALVMQEASISVDLLRKPTAGTLSDQTDLDCVQRMLHSTRESLSDLRNLARGTDGEDTTADPPCRTVEDPATARLADQVGNLLEMIEPDESAGR